MINFAFSNKDSIPLRWKKLRPALSNGGLFFIMKQSYPTQRVIVYVDGFNFYYGIKKKPWNNITGLILLSCLSSLCYRIKS